MDPWVPREKRFFWKSVIFDYVFSCAKANDKSKYLPKKTFFWSQWQDFGLFNFALPCHSLPVQSGGNFSRSRLWPYVFRSPQFRNLCLTNWWRPVPFWVRYLIPEAFRRKKTADFSGQNLDFLRETSPFFAFDGRPRAWSRTRSGRGASPQKPAKLVIKRKSHRLWDPLHIHLARFISINFCSYELRRWHAWTLYRTFCRKLLPPPGPCLTFGWVTVTSGDGTMLRLPYTRSSFVEAFAFGRSVGYSDNHQGSDRPNPDSSEEVDIPVGRRCGIRGNGGYRYVFQGSGQGAHRSPASWRSGSHRLPPIFTIPSLEVVPTRFSERLWRCHVRYTKEGRDNNAWACTDRKLGVPKTNASGADPLCQRRKHL